MAAQFDPEQFLLKPTEESLSRLKKSELITFALHLKLTQIKAGWMKADICQTISQYLLAEGMFETVLLPPTPEDALKIRELELQERAEIHRLENEREITKCLEFEAQVRMRELELEQARINGLARPL